MKKFFAEKRTDRVIIPARMTAYLQTLDIEINKSFMEITDYIATRMVGNDRGNFVKPKLQETVT